jgi:hypothetical protein
VLSCDILYRTPAGIGKGKEEKGIGEIISYQDCTAVLEKNNVKKCQCGKHVLRKIRYFKKF